MRLPISSSPPNEIPSDLKQMKTPEKSFPIIIFFCKCCKCYLFYFITRLMKAYLFCQGRYLSDQPYFLYKFCPRNSKDVNINSLLSISNPLWQSVDPLSKILESRCHFLHMQYPHSIINRHCPNPLIILVMLFHIVEKKYKRKILRQSPPQNGTPTRRVKIFSRLTDHYQP